MRHALLIAMLAVFCSRAHAEILYQQSPSPAGGSFMSSWWEPDGSNYDRYVWDAFSLASAASIRSVQWRGTYGASGPATNFTVAIYASIAAGTQPDLSGPPLVEYQTGGNAGQTYAGVFGGAAMYDHAFNLPAAFPAQAGVRYWLQIEGWQPGFPDWSIAAGLGGNGSHFLCEHNNIANGFGVPTGCWFTTRTGDAAFTLNSTLVTGVDDVSGDVAFALGSVLPNPSRGDRLEVTFTLPGTAPAHLALFDIGGRCVISREVGALGAGSHTVDLATAAPVRVGIYFLSLIRGGHSRTTRVAVVR